MLRLKQKEQIEKVLTLEQGKHWKVLILDVQAQKTLTQLFRVNDLRLLGVTLNLSFESPREKLVDVPGVYLVTPTRESILRICTDLEGDLYSNFHLCFIQSVPKELLSFFASECVRRGLNLNTLTRVWACPLGFISIEPCLFSVDFPGSFSQLHSSTATEENIIALSEKLASSLCSTLQYLSAESITIRFQDKTAAEFVGRRLHNLVQAEQSSFRGLEKKGNRVLFCLIDRSFDIITPLKHVSEYNALVKDLLMVQGNTVRYPKNGNINLFDIEGSDRVWSAHGGKELSETIEEIVKATARYREEELRLTGTSTVPLENASHMRTAVDSLPALCEQKLLLAGHFSISESLVAEVNRRNLDRFFNAEQKLSSISESEVLEMLGHKETGTEEDKMRLGLLYLLTKSTPKGSTEIETALKALGCDMRPFSYAKRLLSISNLDQQVQESQRGGFLQSFVSSVRTIIPSTTKTALTKQLEAFEQGAGTELQLLGERRSSLRPNILVVFVVGGATYSEYNDFQRHFSKKYRETLFGTTEVINAASFLSLLGQCQ